MDISLSLNHSEFKHTQSTSWLYAGYFILFSLAFSLALGFIGHLMQFKIDNVGASLGASFFATIIAATLVTNRFYKLTNRLYTKREFYRVCLRGALNIMIIIVPIALCVYGIILCSANAFSHAFVGKQISSSIALGGLLIMALASAMAFGFQWLFTFTGLKFAVRNKNKLIERE